MQGFTFENTDIKNLVIVSPFFTDDNRGYFLKSYEKEIFEKNGIQADIFEDFETYSKKGVVRGLHFQTKSPQSKLVRVIAGEVFDVAVDLRPESETFSKWIGIYLSEDNHRSFFIPEGFAHGFLVLSDTALVSYKCSGKYLSEFDTGILWNDNDIGIDWPLHLVNEVLLSEKDKKLQTLRELKAKVLSDDV